MTTLPLATRPPDRPQELLAAYAQHCTLLPMSATSAGDRLAGARRFLGEYPDLQAWMGRPLAARLADLARVKSAWQLVGFAAVTGRARVDFDLLAARHVGRSFAGAAAALFAEDLTTLRAAAARLGLAGPWTETVIGEAVPLAVAATGHRPSALSEDDIDQVRAAVRTSAYYTPAVRRSHLSHLHSLARLLYEARIIDTPPIHRRGQGPGNLASRLSVSRHRRSVR